MSHLHYETMDQVGLLTLCRESTLNALNSSLLEELLTFFTNVQEKVVIIKGKGEKAFVSGADIQEMQKMDSSTLMHFSELGHQVMNTIATASCFTIAAVHGYALGGGLELALACDFFYASERAKIGFPEVTLGLIPGFGGTQRLTEAIGRRRAKELIATGTILNGKQAHQLGLCNQVFDPKILLEETLKTAKTIAKHSSQSIQAVKRSIDFGFHRCLEDSLKNEQKEFVACFETKECQNKLNAFAEKR